MVKWATQLLFAGTALPALVAKRSKKCNSKAVLGSRQEILLIQLWCLKELFTAGL